MATRKAAGATKKTGKKPGAKVATKATGGKKKPAGDPVKVDSKHYTVQLENNRVRVLRIRYGPREVSVMHRHPAAVAVFLTDVQARFTFPDGRTTEESVKAGDVVAYPAGEHLPENVSDRPMELVLVELKR
jgi:quercetin dioxygenase-like cupin family protein